MKMKIHKRVLGVKKVIKKLAMEKILEINLQVKFRILQNLVNQFQIFLIEYQAITDSQLAAFQ